MDQRNLCRGKYENFFLSKVRVRVREISGIQARQYRLNFKENTNLVYGITSIFALGQTRVESKKRRYWVRSVAWIDSHYSRGQLRELVSRRQKIIKLQNSPPRRECYVPLRPGTSVPARTARHGPARRQGAAIPLRESAARHTCPRLTSPHLTSPHLTSLPAAACEIPPELNTSTN